MGVDNVKFEDEGVRACSGEGSLVRGEGRMLASTPYTYTRLSPRPKRHSTREGSKTTLRDVPARLGPEAAQVGQSLSSSL